MSAENTAQPARGSAWRYVLPLAAFLILAVFLGIGLNLNPREVPSPLVGKTAPHFDLPQLHRADLRFSEADMRGKAWLLNVWASWCAACRDEHPVLVQLAKSGVIPIVGLNYKDKRNEGIAWLARFGDPYVLSAYDEQGRVGIDYGVYGVPETYVIDKRGVIRYKRIGIVTPQILQEKILPLISELNRE